MFGKRLITGVLALGAMLGIALVPGLAQAGQSFPKTINIAANDHPQGRILNVGVGRSVVVNLAMDVADVLVSEPDVADATVKSRNRVIILGNKAGQASLVLFGSNGQELATFNLVVETDTSDLSALIAKVIPNSNITAQSVSGNVVLTGTAASAEDAQRAAELAARFSGQGVTADKILNMIKVSGKDQVQLKVTVAEVERSLIKQLGVDLNGSFSVGNFSGSFNNDTAFTVNPSVTGQSTTSLGIENATSSLNAELQALQRDGVVRTLAEPTLTAISGENASFLAGGEYPIPTSQDNGTISVTYKKFGVGLDFTPVVLSGGNISLRVKTEVSELSSDGSVSTNGITISALKVRRAESTVELPSGGSLVMAGLLKETYGQTINGVPGLMQVPILGSLFKSRDFLRQQTELVVFVTPYVVKPVAESKLTRPDQNLAPDNDASAIFLNRINRVFGKPASTAQGEYFGQVGYIYE